MKKLLHHGVLIGALLAGMAFPLCAQNQTPGSPADSNKASRHAQWEAMHEKMAAEIKAQDAQLEQLQKQMNNAPESRKAEATAALLNQLVQDRLTIHQQWENMRKQMRTSEPEHVTPPPS